MRACVRACARAWAHVRVRVNVRTYNYTNTCLLRTYIVSLRAHIMLRARVLRILRTCFNFAVNMLQYKSAQSAEIKAAEEAAKGKFPC